MVGARLAASLCIFSKAVKNNWSPAYGEEKKEAWPIHDKNRICTRAEEDHVWVAEFNSVLQEQKMLEHLPCEVEVPCVWQWCSLWHAAPEKLNEYIRRNGTVRNKMDNTH